MIGSLVKARRDAILKSIKDKLLEQDKKFISLREMLERLAQYGEGSTLAEAGRYLQGMLGKSDSLWFVHTGRQGDPLRVLPANIEPLLANVVAHGSFEKGDPAYTDHCVQRSALYLLLAQDGIVLEPDFVLPEPLPKEQSETVAPPPSWPWGAHTTKRLESLKAAAQQFWASYDHSDMSRAPTNEVVTEWLMKERGELQSNAKAIASMLRPDGLKTGPRPAVSQTDANGKSKMSWTD